MKTFVVSWISFIDNELISEKVEASGPLEAIEFSGQTLVKRADYNENEIDTVEKIKEEAFNVDGMINVLEI